MGKSLHSLLKMGLRSFRKETSPPQPLSGYALRGPFLDWSDAVGACSGYHCSNILEAVEGAMAAVASGDAAMERDGVALRHPEFPFPLIAALLDQGCRAGGQVGVLDFGGSLGSSYWACRGWLTGLSLVRWCVVEQPVFVERGQTRWSNDELDFFESIAACQDRLRPNVALLSGVLMYLDDPFTILRQVAETGVETIVIDRTLISLENSPLIFVEEVTMPTYTASYPCRCLTLPSIFEAMEGLYELRSEFLTVDAPPVGHGNLGFAGAIFRKKS